MLPKRHTQEGFTLLETVVAVGIISAGVLSIITLGIVILSASRSTSTRFQANNFAREGIEVVRMVRDSNWLAIDSGNTAVSWNDGLHDLIDYSGVVTIFDEPDTGEFIAFDVDIAGDTCTDANGETYDCSAIWYDSVNERYFQTVAGANPGDTFDSLNPDYTQSAFQRVVRMYPICRNDADPTDETIITVGTCGSGYTQVGVDVRSRVTYQERGETQTVTLEEYLYDWKY